MYGGGERHVQGFGGETWGKETTGETQAIDGRVILSWIFRKWDVGLWTGSSWLRTGTGGRHLWMRSWTSGSIKWGGISWLSANQLVSQEGLCSMELISTIWLDCGLDDKRTISDFYMHNGFTPSLKYSDHTGSQKASFTIGTGGYFPGSKVATARIGQLTFI